MLMGLNSPFCLSQRVQTNNLLSSYSVESERDRSGPSFSPDHQSNPDRLLEPPMNCNLPPAAVETPQHDVPLRRSARSTAGYHSNPHNLPRTAAGAGR